MLLLSKSTHKLENLSFEEQKFQNVAFSKIRVDEKVLSVFRNETTSHD